MTRKALAALAAAAAVAGGLAYWQLSSGDEAVAVSDDISDERPASKAPAKLVQKPPQDTAAIPQSADQSLRDDDPEGPLLLEGQVLDDNDLPVGGATVVLSSHPPRTAISEDDGSFSFDKLVPRSYALHARKDDLAGGPVIHELTESSEPAAIRMTIGATLVVTAVDPEDRPVVGATIEVRTGDARSEVTDSKGVARFRGMSGGYAAVVASADGRGVVHQPAQIPEQAGTTVSVRVVMHEGAPISGTVVDENGAPIAGAQVLARRAAELFVVSSQRRDAVTSDDKGRFTLPAQARGTYRVLATHSDYAPASTELVTADGSNPIADLSIEMVRGGRMAGRVVDGEGSAVPFAEVRVRPRERGYVNTGAGSLSARQTTADKDGEFALTGLTRAELSVIALSESASSADLTVDLRTETRRDDLILELTITGTIAGVVVDAAGDPVAEAQVTAIPDFFASDTADHWSTRGLAAETTDGGGQFAFRGLPDGKYRIHAARSKVSSMQFRQPGTEAETGTSDLRLVLDEPSRIIGKVAFDNGGAPAAFTVTAGFPPGVPVANSTGEFAVADLPPGKYDVTFRGAGFAPRTVRDVVVTAGQDSDMGTIAVKRGRSVSGRVVASDGTAVGGATVVVARQVFGDGTSIRAGASAGMDEFLGAKSIESDAGGYFAIEGIGRGEMQIVAESDEVGRSLPAVIPAGDQDITRDLQLRPFGSVTGKVTVGGEPAANVPIMAAAKTGSQQTIMVQTGQDGTYVFERLPEGPHRLTANLMKGFTAATSSGADAEVIGGQQVRADIAIDVGDIAVEVTIEGKDGAEVNSAQVFLFKGQVNASNGKEVNDA
ncbi:MAG: carboxypeptidase-like regulatory domain-containing protein, partial [Myxococcota bacterium]